MAIFYVLGCIVILVMNAAYVGPSHRVDRKIGVHPVCGGRRLYRSNCYDGCRFGIARGLFSNESGLGSAPIVAAAAQTRIL